jgi:hypothetical protein
MNYNFDCGFVGIWNLVSDIEGGTQTEGICEQGVQDTIWIKERWYNMRLEKTA